MRKFFQRKFYNTVAIGTATANMPVIVPPIDISNMDRFCLVFQNSNTGINFLNLHVQGAIFPDGTAADQSPHWVQINTSTLPQPSALGATAIVMTPPVDNAYHWIRVLGATSATAGVGTFAITVAGFQREK